MYNDLFSVGPFTIHGYGLMIAMGVIAAYVTACIRAKRLKIDPQPIDMLLIWILVGGIGGAKLLYWLTQIPQIIQNPGILLDFADGFVVYGGIIGGILATFFYCKWKKLHFLVYFDLLIPSVALAQGFGRIGCFLAGCCYGRETSGACAVVFPHGSSAPAGVPLVPIQLISSGLNFLLFLVLVLSARRKKWEGQVAALYLVLYSIGRFVVEFFRGDLGRGTVGPLSTSQFISILLFAGAGTVFLLQCSRNHTGKETQMQAKDAHGNAE